LRSAGDPKEKKRLRASINFGKLNATSYLGWPTKKIEERSERRNKTMKHAKICEKKNFVLLFFIFCLFCVTLHPKTRLDHRSAYAKATPFVLPLL